MYVSELCVCTLRVCVTCTLCVCVCVCIIVCVCVCVPEQLARTVSGKGVSFATVLPISATVLVNSPRSEQSCVRSCLVFGFGYFVKLREL